MLAVLLGAHKVVCTCRQSVPLAVALMHVSNPDVQALDALSRLSHDTDPDVAANAVLALGAHLRSLACQHQPCRLH